MPELTSQERLALLVLCLLIAGGAVARHLVGLEKRAEAVQYASIQADTLNPGSAQRLRKAVEGEVAEAKVRSQRLAAGEKLDPNSATAVQLDRLPGIGPALADRIVEQRQARGRFRSIDELGEVPGIGEALLRRIAPHLDLVAGARSQAPSQRPLDLNRASAAELEKLPGIGPAIAGRIVDYREANGRFSHWEDLEKVPGIGPALRRRLESAARLGT